MKKYLITISLVATIALPFAAHASVLSDLRAQINTLQAKITNILTRRASSTDVTAPFNNVYFKCENGKAISAKVEVRPKALGKVQLKLSDRKPTLILSQTRSASGARYANKDESFIFWNKGDSAFIEEKGSITFKNCVLSQNTKKTDDQVVCTQDAKQCPDGSYVGRTGPKCEFKACPKANNIGWQIYRNEEYGFEFKYSPEFRITAGDLEYRQSPVVAISKQDDPCDKCDVRTSFEVRLLTATTTLSDFFKMDNGYDLDEPNVLQSYSSVNLNGAKAYLVKYLVTDAIFEKSPRELYFVYGKKYKYVLSPFGDGAKKLAGTFKTL